LFRPDLRNQPIVVLSNNDGWVIARSNEVKALGIAMGERCCANNIKFMLFSLCFIYHRYQQIMDNLITSFMYPIRAIAVDAKAYAEKAKAEYHSGLIVDLPKLAKFLKWFPNRKKGLNHDELNQAAYKILPEEQFPALAQFFTGQHLRYKSSYA
jgi:hypothetical protein